jgi:plastocyanin
MKKIFFSFVLMMVSIIGYSTTWVVSNSGFDFEPATITISLGDSVLFTVSGIHKPIEVSEATWNANGNSPITGFNLPFGGGLLLPEQLTEGTHFYVCQPHASSGMKGKIIVENTTSIAPQPYDADISIFPNPSGGHVQVLMKSSTGRSHFDLEIFDMHGTQVHAARNLEQESLIELYLGELGTGVYFVRLDDGAHSYIRRMVVQ